MFDRFWWYLDLETLGMPLGRGEPFCAKPMSFFFSISPIFNLVTANDRYENSPEGFFIFSLGPPLGVLSPI